MRSSLFAQRYAIRRKLGAGSLGAVYLASDIGTKSQVALKIIHTERLGRSAIPEMIARMQGEFRAITSLDHPQIAKAFDFGYTEPGGIPYYTREYIQGAPLPAGPPGREPPSRFLRPILDLLDALEYVHEQGILHLDIHAGNLIVADQKERGSVLIDIGLLKPFEASRFTTSPKDWTSLPPELLEHGDLGPRTDIFLVGRLLQFRLTGRMSDSPDLPKEIPGWGTRLTLHLERIIAKALQRSPPHRFASASELCDALSTALGGGEGTPRIREPHAITVGRESTLTQIEQSLRGAAAGESAVVWLTGKTGSGKTHTLMQARLAAQLRGLRTLEISFAGGGDASAVLARTVGLQRRAETHFYSWLEPLDPRHGGTPFQRAQRAAEAYFSESAPPLVLLLDDYDHAETESRILVEALMAECSRREKQPNQARGLCLILATTRAPKRPVRCRTLHLGSLATTDARKLLLTLLGAISLPDEVVRRAVIEAGGNPLRLRQISRALRQEWMQGGDIPRTVEMPDFPPVPSRTGRDVWLILQPFDREVAEVLAILARAATREELAAALDCDPRMLSRSLRRLLDLELVTAQGKGGKRRFRLAAVEDRENLLERAGPARARRIHRRMAAFLKAYVDPAPGDLENLTRHLLASGRSGGRGSTEARSTAIHAARLLRADQSFDRAVRLLEECCAREKKPCIRLELAEEISDILEETGDHERGIAALEPLAHEKELPAKDAIRIHRRLGIHCHRAGQAERAQVLFEGALRSADPVSSVEDLLFIDTELAELHLFRGSLDRAEEACRRGLDRLQELEARAPFSGRMEVMLRASLGHIEMRRMALHKARPELERALRLSKGRSTTAERATILHNLAIVENQTNDFAAARRHFREAEKMLLAAGENRNAVKIATNLAVIAAKLGEVEQAQMELDRASRVLRRYPGPQIEFFFTYSQGLVALLSGKAEAAAASIERSLSMGRKLGDIHLVRFGEIYLAEALLFCGRYQKARRLLRTTARTAAAEKQPLLSRMAHARLQLVEALLGSERLASGSRGVFDATPKTDVELLEAWNELFLGLGELVSGKAGDSRFEGALEAFTRLGVPSGIRFTRVAMTLSSILARDSARLAELQRGKAADGDRPHSFLNVAEPLVIAVGHFQSGRPESAEEWLSRASSAIVGSPFLELDWGIECLRAHLALRHRDAGEARRHIHRSLHTRDILLQLLPPQCRESFLAHHRFAPLTKIAARLESSPACSSPVSASPVSGGSTASLWSKSSFEGMVGRSAGMLRVFQTIELIKDQELPLLITGETGTGKELVARAIFRRSHRRKGPFLAVHCASIPEELFEAELFGCTAGSFTGADEDRPGILETLDGGTALLDDVQSLSLPCQAKFLKVIDSCAIRRLGSTAPLRIDVRFIFATSLDLAKAVADGSFRKDLYYRVRGLEISLPPLRERKEDIPLLARHFLEKHAARLERPAPALDDGALEALKAHDWPGNVRELEMILLRALVNLSPGGALLPAHLESLLQTAGASRTASAPSRNLLARELGDWRTDLEREYLVQLFLEVRGDPAAMIERLGVKRTRLYAWFRELGIDVKALRAKLRGPAS